MVEGRAEWSARARVHLPTVWLSGSRAWTPPIFFFDNISIFLSPVFYYLVKVS